MLLFYFIFFALIIFRFKNFVFAFALLFYLTLLVSDDFYWIISEYQQGMAYLCLYGAWLMEKQKSDSLIKHWWIHFLIILWIQFFYLLIVFPIVFMFFFLFFINEKRNFKSFTIFLAITIASFIFRYFAGKLDWYELEKIHSLSSCKTQLVVCRSFYLFLGAMLSLFFVEKMSWRQADMLRVKFTVKQLASRNQFVGVPSFQLIMAPNRFFAMYFISCN